MNRPITIRLRSRISGEGVCTACSIFLFAGGARLRPADRIGRGRYFGILLENRPRVNLFKKWESSFLTRVILLGQTLGPFSTLYNQLAVRYLMPRLEVYARDRVSVDYLRDNFRVNASLSADLAFADLPLQGDRTIESAVLERYGLERDGYFTVVVSAGQRGGKYYCQDEADYLDCYRDIIGSLAQKEALADKKSSCWRIRSAVTVMRRSTFRKIIRAGYRGR